MNTLEDFDDAAELERDSTDRNFWALVTQVEPEPMPPIVLDRAPETPGERYERERVLGVGGMGEVHLKRDRRIGREVAWKSMRAEVSGNPDYRIRFVREARIQGQLDHPTVVPVYDLGASPDGTPFFTMRRVTGLALDRVIEALTFGDREILVRFALRKRLVMFQRLCLGVQYAHSRGVVHRDLKPGNIMVGRWGETYILDWGLAKVLDEKGAARHGARSTLGGRLMGTPGYMAPEQTVAADTVDARADVYALGAILFELLTLKPLHDTSSPQATLRSTQIGADARASERAPDLDLPPELDAVCVKATALESRQRYPSARALYEAVEQFLEGQRDVDVRRQLAAKHARAAARAADDGTARGRNLAAREAGRALALDPESRDALALVMKLALHPPKSTPPSALTRVREEDQREQILASKIGILVYSPIAISAVVIGVLSGEMALALVCAGALLGAVLLCARLVRWPSTAEPQFALATSMCAAAAVGAAALWFGPVFIVPQLAVANAVSLNIRNLGSYRWIHVAMASLAVVVPAVLEWTGAIPRKILFENGTLKLLLPKVALFDLGVPAAVFIVSALAVAGAATVLWRLDDNMARQNIRLHRQLWHLRHLVPHPRPGAAPRGEPVARAETT